MDKPKPDNIQSHPPQQPPAEIQAHPPPPRAEPPSPDYDFKKPRTRWPLVGAALFVIALICGYVAIDRLGKVTNKTFLSLTIVTT
jgi:hypothetical protein